MLRKVKQQTLTVVTGDFNPSARSTKWERPDLEWAWQDVRNNLQAPRGHDVVGCTSEMEL